MVVVVPVRSEEGGGRREEGGGRREEGGGRREEGGGRREEGGEKVWRENEGEREGRQETEFDLLKRNCASVLWACK